MNFLDLTGQRYGRLLVIKRVENSKNGKVRFICKCDCGKEKVVLSNHLRIGKTTSCGCFHKEGFADIKRTHGKRNTRIYRIWNGMNARCAIPSATGFKNYGGRGISVCQEWKESFVAFYEWAILHGYEETLTIDRINVNGNYEPSNCRWATIEQQNNNTRKQQYGG